MRIAVISDIHGNHIALEEVLKEVKKLGVEMLFVLGDYVGYYYRPDIVLELLEPWKKVWIGGNHEVMLDKAMRSDEERREIKKKYGHGIEQAFQVLTKDQISRIVNLKKTEEVSFCNRKILLCHGSPWESDYYIYPDIDESELSKFAPYFQDLIFFGHTHHAVIFRYRGSLIINPGSVGQSREQGSGGKAKWLLCDLGTNMFQFRSTPYNIKDILEDARKFDPCLHYNQAVLTR